MGKLAINETLNKVYSLERSQRMSSIYHDMDNSQKAGTIRNMKDTNAITIQNSCKKKNKIK